MTRTRVAVTHTQVMSGEEKVVNPALLLFAWPVRKGSGQGVDSEKCDQLMRRRMGLIPMKVV